jgi:hypothetical protein
MLIFAFIIIGALALLYFVGQEHKVLATIPVAQPSGQTVSTPVLIPASIVPEPTPTTPATVPIGVPVNVTQPGRASVNMYAVVGVNAQNNLFGWKFIDRIWESITGEGKIVSSRDGKIVRIGRGQEIYLKNLPDSDWIHIPGSLKEVDIGCDGKLYGVNDIGSMYVYTDNNWMLIPGNGARITANAEAVWHTNIDNAIFRCDAPCNLTRPKWVQTSGAAKYIDAGCNGETWAIGTNKRAFKTIDKGASWQSTSDFEMRSLSVGRDAVYGTKADGTVYECVNPCNGDWKKIDGTIFSVG